MYSAGPSITTLQACLSMSLTCPGMWSCRFPSTAWPILNQLLKSHQPLAKRSAQSGIAKHTAKPKPLTNQASKPAKFSSKRRVRFDVSAEQAPDTGFQQEHGPASSPVHEPSQVSLTHQQQCMAALQTDSLTDKQKGFCDQLGLGTRGPAGTAADGECLFRSFAQSDAMISKGTLWAMTHSEQAQSKYAVLRHTAAAQIRENSLIKDGIVQYAAQLTSDNRFQGADYERLLAASIHMPVSSGMTSQAALLSMLFLPCRACICACIQACMQ